MKYHVQQTASRGRRAVWALSFLALLGLVTGCSENAQNAQNAQDGWPKRDVNIIVFASAGGATDLANRAIAASMEADLGVGVRTSNMPGAMGGTAANYVWNQKHDGYNLVGLSEGALTHSVLGMHPTTTKDWEYFMVSTMPGIVSVSSSSPYKTFGELYEAVKKSPKTLTVATSIPGSVWNVQWLNTVKIGGFETRFIPYSGSFPSQTAALSGEVDVVWTGLGEQSEFIKGDKLRPLAVFDSSPVTFNNNVIPAITDFIPELKNVMPINQFVGFALPGDTPKPIQEKITKAFKAGMQSDVIKQFSESKHSPLYGYYGEKAKAILQEQERVFAWTLWEAGIAKKNPTEFGIEKPQ